MEIKDIISRVINSHQGINGVELVIEVMYQASVTPFPIEEYENALIELVTEKEIVEVEYTLPTMDYRVKSWYLPKGTMVEVSERIA